MSCPTTQISAPCHWLVIVLFTTIVLIGIIAAFTLFDFDSIFTYMGKCVSTLFVIWFTC